jgi:DNA-binding CsgD family transcriptional regulator
MRASNYPGKSKNVINMKHKPTTELTRREQQVYDGIVAGKTNKATARDLNLSEKTTSTYRVRLMVKMGFSTARELIRHAEKMKVQGRIAELEGVINRYLDACELGDAPKLEADAWAELCHSVGRTGRTS